MSETQEFRDKCDPEGCPGCFEEGTHCSGESPWCLLPVDNEGGE